MSFGQLKSEIQSKYPPYKDIGFWNIFLGRGSVSECSETIHKESIIPGVPEIYTQYYVTATYGGREYLKYFGKRKSREDLPPPVFIAVAVLVGIVPWTCVLLGIAGKWK